MFKWNRVLVALIGVPLLFFVYMGEAFFRMNLQGLPMLIFTNLVVAIGTYEFYKMVKISGKEVYDKILKENNYSVIATYLDKEALPYNKIKLKEKNAVIFGNEGRGICDEFINISDCKTIIPILSNTESLNVAVATGIILYKFREIEGAF